MGSLGYGQVAIDDIAITQGFCPDQGMLEINYENFDNVILIDLSWLIL